MKNISTLLNILALALIAVLFYLHFSSRNEPKKLSNESRPVQKPAGGVTIAYFDMDSVENNLEYVKDAMEKFKAKEQQMHTQLNSLRNSYQKRIAEWQQKGANMSQSENEMAQREYQQMNEKFQTKQKELEMELQDLQMKSAQEVNKKIEDYLKVYNRDKGFSYIMTSQPGFIYYKDSVYNITSDVIAGLNADYKANKK
jgi:outer membrane protein